MKKFILGFISGVLITLGVFFVIGYANGNKESNQELKGLTLIENGETMPCKQVRIFQVLRPNVALSHLTNKPEEIYDSDRILVLLIGDEKDNFYDQQKINIPSGKAVKRIGTYTYPTKASTKTVPAVEIK